MILQKLLVELIDKTTGNVVETRTVTASSGIQKFTTTTAASNGELTCASMITTKVKVLDLVKLTNHSFNLDYEVGAEYSSFSSSWT